MKFVSLTSLIAAPGALAAAGPYLSGGETCSDMQPICFDGQYKFKFSEENTISSYAWRRANPDDFGCLDTSPGEQWFYFQTDESREAAFNMKSYKDHDYAIWGPYDTLDEAKSRCGNTGAPKDCSYSETAHEHASLGNAEAGKFYTLLVTNYAEITQELNVATDGIKTSCEAVDTKFQIEYQKWVDAGAQAEVMAGNPTVPPPVPPTEPVFESEKCDPKECDNWTCKNWCKCFKAHPEIIEIFEGTNPSADEQDIRAKCPADNDECDCTPFLHGNAKKEVASSGDHVDAAGQWDDQCIHMCIVGGCEIMQKFQITLMPDGRWMDMIRYQGTDAFAAKMRAEAAHGTPLGEYCYTKCDSQRMKACL